MNEEKTTQSVNEYIGEYIVEFWKDSDVSPLKFKCHTWYFDEKNKYITINHFQKITIVNMDNYDYMTSFPLDK